MSGCFDKSPLCCAQSRWSCGSCNDGFGFLFSRDRQIVCISVRKQDHCDSRCGCAGRCSYWISVRPTGRNGGKEMSGQTCWGPAERPVPAGRILSQLLQFPTFSSGCFCSQSPKAPGQWGWEEVAGQWPCREGSGSTTALAPVEYGSRLRWVPGVSAPHSLCVYHSCCRFLHWRRWSVLTGWHEGLTLLYDAQCNCAPTRKRQKFIFWVRGCPLETGRMGMQKTLPLHRSHSGLNFQLVRTTFVSGTYNIHSSLISLLPQT